MTARPGLLRLLETFDRLEIAYMVVGSTASSIYGFYRATADVDFVIDLAPEGVDEFVGELARDFYIDKDQIRAAFRFGRAFNVIHLETAYKLDLFPRKQGSYPGSQFARRRYEGTSIFARSRPHRTSWRLKAAP
jgi:hypothetical protein